MYADAFGLLVFGPLLTSVSLSKNKFFDRLNKQETDVSCLLRYSLILHNKVYVYSARKGVCQKCPICEYERSD